MVVHPSGTGCGLTGCLKQADLSEPAQEFLKFHDVSATKYDIDLDYDFWNAGEVVSLGS